MRSPLQPLATGYRDKMARQLALRQAARPEAGAAPAAAPAAPPDTAPPPAFAEGGKAPKPISPNFDTTEFGIGTMHTRKGSGRMTDDLPSDLNSARPGLYGPHNREEPDVSGAYAKGGKVKSFGFASGGSSKFGKDYKK
jgi:hypothetical protein